MKTWEMIKNLSENPNKKFISNYTKDNYYIAEVNNENLSIVDSYNNKPIIFISLKREWEEVKEPVDFMEVLKRIKDSDGDIRLMLINDLYEVEIKNKTFDKVLYHLSIDYLDTSIADILLNGKWYIEED